MILCQRASVHWKSRQTHLSTANDTFVLVVAKGAFVADADKSCWSHITVANRTLAVALVAEAADGDSRRLATHDQIAGWLSVCCLSEKSTVSLTGDGETWLIVELR